MRLMLRVSENGAVVRITSADARALAAAGACLPAVIAIVAGVVVFGAPAGSAAYAYRPVSAVVMVPAAVVALLGFVRAARVATELSPEGVVVRNPWRTYRMSWNNVAWFGNGLLSQGEAGFKWVLAIGRPTPARAVCCHSAAPTKRASQTEIRAAIQPFAVSHAVPERFDDSSVTVAPGLTWLYDKLRIRRKH
jgi:hypothetical protein